MRTIIAIGGGGFKKTASDDNALNLGTYIIEQARTITRPKVCFLSQASAESKEYITWFYKTFLALGAQPSYISLFGRVEPQWQQQLLEADIIYVGGGNTRSMLALWGEWGVDRRIREAYDAGCVLAGVSAGAICWFEQAITDSVWPLGVIPGLGFLPGSCCPHYDTEPERRPAYLAFSRDGTALPGIALEDEVAAHFVDGKLHAVVSLYDNKKAVAVANGLETALPARCL